MLHGQLAEYIEMFCYISSIVFTNGGAAVNRRLNKARAAFGSVQPAQITKKKKQP